MNFCCKILLLLLLVPVTGSSQYQVNGNANQTSCNCYDLTDAANVQVGSVWNVNLIDLTNSFDFTFDIFLGCSDGGADGMVFALQPLGTGIGINGNGMGLGGVTPSFGAYIDTYQNSSPDFDPWEDHASINANGNVIHNGGPDDLAGPAVLSNMEDCAWHTLQVIWNASTLTFDMLVDGNATLSYTGDIVNTIFGGNPQVYWGFTAATGGLNNAHKFCTQLDAQWITGSTSACPGQPLVFSDSSSSFGAINSWSWDFGDGNTATGTPASHTYTNGGVYNVELTITDASGCTDDYVFPVTIASPVPTATATPDIICAGQTTQLDVQISPPPAGSCTYTLTLNDSYGDGWNGSSLDLLQNGINIGNFGMASGSNIIHTVSVQDGSTITIVFNNGSYNSECSYIFTDPQGNTVSSAATGTMSPGTFFNQTVTCGFAPPVYDISWTPAPLLNNATIANPIGSPTSTTSFVVTVSDQNGGCSASDTIIVTVGGMLIDPISDLADCDQVTLPPITGTGLTSNPTYFTGSMGTGSSLAPGSIYNTPGTITLYAYDNDGTCFTEDTLSVSITPMPTPEAGPNEVVCGNLATTLAANTPGTSGTWMGSAGVIFGNINNPNSTVQVPSSGNYWFYWTEDNGNNCAATDSVNILFSDLSFTNTITPSNCGQSDGEINLTPSGGAPTYSFSIDNGITQQANGNFVNLSAGNYVAWIGDQAGCSLTSNLTVSNLNGPVINQISTTSPSCANNCDGSISVNASGATLYQLDNGPFQNVNNFSGLCPGNYNITIENAINCQVSQSVTISAVSAINTTLTPVQAQCFGTCDGNISVSASGGSGIYQYSINNGNSFQNSTNFDGLCAGLHTIIVSDNAGCNDTTSVTINEPAPISLNYLVVDDTCAGSCSGYISVIANGGQGSLTFNWSNGAGNTNYNNNLCPGFYDLTVTDANGCIEDSLGIEIASPPPAVIQNVTTQDATCFGLTNGSISINAANALSYALSQTGPYSSSATFTGLGAGNYTIFVKDSGGCVVNTIASIGQPNEIIIQNIPSQQICIGGIANITTSVTGGSGNYIYSWDNGLSTAGIQVNPTTTSTYCVNVIDDVGCVSNPSCVLINVYGSISVNAFSDQIICEGDNASIGAFASGGDGGPYTYVWDQNTGLGANQNVSPLTTTTYTVSVTDGCETPAETAAVTITVSTLPAFDFNVNLSEGCLPLTCTFSSNVPTGYDCFWNFGDGNTGNNCGSEIHEYDNLGCWDVSLTVSNIDGCVSSVSHAGIVCVHPNPDALFINTPGPFTLLNSLVEFTNLSTGASNFIWSIDSLDSIYTDNYNFQYQFPNSDTATYQVCLTAISEFGCLDQYCLPVTILDEFILYVPNAFTPNNDQVNDYFLPIISGYEEGEYELYIFNRWGELIFQTTSPTEGWYGQYRGVDAPSGVYIWKLIATQDNTKEVRNYTGHVNLLR